MDGMTPAAEPSDHHVLKRRVVSWGDTWDDLLAAVGPGYASSTAERVVAAWLAGDDPPPRPSEEERADAERRLAEWTARQAARRSRIPAQRDPRSGAPAALFRAPAVEDPTPSTPLRRPASA